MSKQTWQETLVVATGDGTTQTGASANSIIPAAAKFTLPTNYFDYVGKQIRIVAHGRLSCANPTPGTARFDLRFGGTVVADSQAMLLDPNAAHTTEAWYLDMILTCRAIGTSANFFMGGSFQSYALKNVGTMPVGALVAPFPWSGNAPAVGNNFDSTVTNQVDFFFTQTVATGSITLHGYSLISMN
jgi:hypothetical protein